MTTVLVVFLLAGLGGWKFVERRQQLSKYATVLAGMLCEEQLTKLMMPVSKPLYFQASPEMPKAELNKVWEIARRQWSELLVPRSKKRVASINWDWEEMVAIAGRCEKDRNCDARVLELASKVCPDQKKALLDDAWAMVAIRHFHWNLVRFPQ